MSDFRKIEQRTFRAAKDDGLWDVMLASVVAMFAIAPLLSESIGDFWSSVVFLPFWLGIYVVIRLVREHIVEPRLGTIEVGEERRASLRQTGMVLLIVNVIALVVGVVAWFGFGEGWLDLDGLAYPIGLAVVALIGLSAVAVVTSIWRFAFYGLLLAAAPLVGEWLWQNGYAEHHGFPIAFGTVAFIILITGMTRFVTLMRNHPIPEDPVIA